MRRDRLACLAGALLLATVLASPAQECACGPRTLDDLARMSGDELMELFKASSIGRPLDGTAKGRLVHLVDRNAKMRMKFANMLWNGKMGRSSDGWFTNRWIFNINWIASHYVIGPSWIDGKPAVVMEYAPKTPLFWNMHDELREVAPGLYLGPVIERFPCPKFRGFVALQMEDCGCGK